LPKTRRLRYRQHRGGRQGSDIDPLILLSPHQPARLDPNRRLRLTPSTIPEASQSVLKSGDYRPRFFSSIPLSTTFSPQFHHLRTTFYQSIFRSRRLPTTKDNHRQAESNLGTTENSPPFTTNPEDTFSPQQSGPPTAIDFAPVRNMPCGIREGDGRARAKKKAPSSKGWGSRICRRSPNLPHTYACSTIGPTRLNFRVRDGNGCDPRGKLTGKVLKSRSRDLPQLNRLGVDVSNLSTLASST
jgi:hypothetical protein